MKTYKREGRRAQAGRIALLCAFALIVSGCASRPNAHASGPATARFQHVPIGVGEDYAPESRTFARAQRDVEVLKANGLRDLRISFPWDAIEPERGRYDWSFWDQLVGLAASNHIRLLPYVCYTPRWAAAGSGQDFWRRPPRSTQDFADFVGTLVNRYKLTIHSWELWNEPDNPEYWVGSVEEFQSLLAAGSQAVRESDPKARIVMGGLAWNLNFLEAMLTNSAAVSNVDIFNLHNYYETWSSEPLERIPQYVGRAHDLLWMHGFHKPLWMAEVGYSNFRRNAHVSAQNRAFYKYEHTPEHQATSLFRAITLALASGDVSLVTWYRLNDLKEAQEVIGDANNRYLGLITENGQPKPALRALQYCCTLFGDGFRCIDNTVRVNEPLNGAVQAHAFARPDGSIVVTAWLQTVVAGQRGSDISGNALDRRRETIDVLLPGRLSRAAQVFDGEGRREGTLRVHSDDLHSRITGVRLRGDNVVVLLCGSRDK